MNLQILGPWDVALKTSMMELEEDQENMEQCALNRCLKDLVSGILIRCPERRLEAGDFVAAWASRISEVFDKEIEIKQLKFSFVVTHHVGSTAYGTISLQMIPPACA